MVPKLFGPIRERYASRPGGYTRVLRIEPMKEDQAESAILELVDGPKDLRFARLPQQRQLNEKTAENVKKVTQFREDGIEQLQDMVKRMRLEKEHGIDDRVLPPPRKVYPEEKMKREMHYYEETDHYKVPNQALLNRSKNARDRHAEEKPQESVGR
jgi:large subunit ribosomal protein L17